MLALPFPSSPSVMLMVPAMLVWCCMESRRLLVLLSSKHNIHEHDSAVHWPINPDSTLRSKTEKRLLLLQPTFSLSKRQMPAPSAVEKFGALWKWDYWGAPLLPRRTAAVRLLFQSYLVVRGCSSAPRTGSYTTENFSPRITKLSCSVSVRRTLDQVWLYLFVWKKLRIKILLKSQKSEETKKPPRVFSLSRLNISAKYILLFGRNLWKKLTTANYLPVPFKDRDSAVFHQFLITR